MTRTLVVVVLAALVGVVNSRHASADTFSFAGSGGNLGTASAIFIGSGGGSMAVDGYYFNEVAGWLPANLFQRDDNPADHGLGVCSPADPTTAPNCGGGDSNELDDSGAAELIRLALPFGHEWVSLQLSSLDSTEAGVLWADLDGIPNSGPGSIGDFIVAAFQSDNINIEPILLVPAAFRTAPFLFFEARDHVSGESFDNDFLVMGAVTERVPEPASLTLLGLGLLGAGIAGRRRRSSTARS